jgi:hypothetical protein
VLGTPEVHATGLWGAFGLSKEVADPVGVSVESVVDPLSRSVLYLTLSFRNDEQGVRTDIGTATGVIRCHQGRNYLITALHVLNGKEPDGTYKDAPRNLQPNYLRGQGFFTDFEYPLYQGENRPFYDDPLFWTHLSGAEIDIAVLPLGSGGRAECALNESFFNEQKNAGAVNIYAMHTCHIVGFPEGLIDLSNPNIPLPVYKTGHIASEPHTDFDGKPVILIDGLTRPGQSGAPVFAQQLRGLGIQMPGYCDPGFPTRLIGIYAGRFKARLKSGRDFEHWDVGYAFKPRVITEIFLSHSSS